jgi:lipoyl-dependent peroxiredoxin
MSGPTSVLAWTSAMAEGGRANGKVTICEYGPPGGAWFHMEHAKGFGGSGEGMTPEQFFALGYASCFNSALLFVAAQQKVDVTKARVNCKVGIGPNDAGGFALTVKLAVQIPGMDPTAARALVEAAHQVCPYSNATRGNVPVELEIM